MTTWMDEALQAVMAEVVTVQGSDCAVWLGKRSNEFGYPIILRNQSNDAGPKVLNVPQFLKQWVAGDFSKLQGIPLYRNHCGITGPGYCLNPDHLTETDFVPFSSRR